LTHAGEPFAALVQDAPQAPQFDMSLLVSAQTPPQDVMPLKHVWPHEPPEHAGNPFETAAHAIPQPAQLYAEVVTLTHRSVHRIAGGAQEPAHPAAEHSGVAPVHCTLHAVHVAGLDRSASHPFAGFWSQSAQPGSQFPTVHESATLQLGWACGRLHAAQVPALHPDRQS
jgi:hypothetical protein